MAKLISKHPTTYRGILRDHIRSLIKDEVTKAIEDAPPIILSDANGRSLEVTEEKDTIVREFIRKKLCGKRFLDGPWATLMARSHVPATPVDLTYIYLRAAGQVEIPSTPQCFVQQ